MRVSIYARYSSDKQREASIEDQVRLCEERAAREGWRVVKRYTDRAISGASLMRRGIQALMQDAQGGKFDVVLTELLDRISRDQEDIAGVYKRLRFAGVKIYTLSEGEIAELHIGFTGTMSALYLKSLGEKTWRGQSGRVRAGKSGGGNCYGYDVVRGSSNTGEPERGGRCVNEKEAAIVSYVFNEYAAGKSPKAIAHALNQRKVPGPTGKAWGPSTINGNWRRGTGILNNELYIGRLVWNWLAYVKNPNTGKRVSRLNKRSALIITDVPELRIIDEDLWERVKGRQRGLRKLPSFHEKQRPRMLLSYLLKCGCCGGGFSKVSQNHYGCSTARNKGTCHSRITIRQNTLEGLVVGALQSRLMDPTLLAEFCDEYTRHLNRMRTEKNASLVAAHGELARLTKQRGEHHPSDPGRGARHRSQRRSCSHRDAARRARSAARRDQGRAGPASSEHGSGIPQAGGKPCSSVEPGGKPGRSGRYFALARRPDRIEAEPAGKAGNRPLWGSCRNPHPSRKEGQAARSKRPVSSAG